jgi:hypothetical protein
VSACKAVRPRRARFESLECRTLFAADFGSLTIIGAEATKTAINNDLANAVFVDRAGNTYVAGGFAGTVDFNPSPTKAFKLTSAGFTDAFVAKFAPDGSFLWASQAGGSGEDQATSVKVSSSGGVFVGGAFSTTADFAPGKAAHNILSNGQLDGFVWQVDARHGNFVRAVPMGGGNSDVVTSIALDAAGNVYATGLFQGGSDFGKKDMASAGGHDAFLVKLTPTFGFAYAKKFGGVAEDAGNDVVLDSAGNVYVAGTFNASGDFNPGKKTASLLSRGNEDAFLVKLDASGNFVYAEQFGGSENDEGIALATDRANNVFIAGAFAGVGDFNPSVSSTTLTSAGASDVYVAKINSAGQLVWARRAGGASPDGVHSIKVDRAGNAYLGGQFNGTADFDPGAGTFNLAGTAGVANGFLWKLNSAGSFVYARMLKSQANSFDDVNAIALDGSGNIFIAGKFSGTVDFDPGKKIRTRPTNRPTSYDAFLEKLLA